MSEDSFSLEVMQKAIASFKASAEPLPTLRQILLPGDMDPEAKHKIDKAALRAGVPVFTSPLLDKGTAYMISEPAGGPFDLHSRDFVWAKRDEPLRGWVRMEHCGPKHAEWKLVKLVSGKRVIVDQDTEVRNPVDDMLRSSVAALGARIMRNWEQRAHSLMTGVVS